MARYLAARGLSFIPSSSKSSTITNVTCWRNFVQKVSWKTSVTNKCNKRFAMLTSKCQMLNSICFSRPLLLFGGATFGYCITYYKHVTFPYSYLPIVKCEQNDTAKATKKQQTVKRREFFLWRYLKNIWYAIRLSVRACRLFLTFVPVLILYPLTFLHKRLRKYWWKLLLVAVELSGPAFIKLGQWASTRRDLFSVEFCEEFSKLHHHARPHSWRDTMKILNKAYGKKWRDMFLFENMGLPVGSGCVAQVYKAYIREEGLKNMDLEKIQEDLQENDDESLSEERRLFELGESIEPIAIDFGSLFKFALRDKDIARNEDDLQLYAEPGIRAFDYDPEHLIPIALKVLHPGVHDVFSRDLALMSVMAKFTQMLFPSLRWVSLTECVAEFSRAMKKQMNMHHEAKCLTKLAENFSNHPNVRIPTPLSPLIRTNVLVESFENGEPISMYLKNDSNHVEGLKEKLAELGIDALLQMVFVNNFVHGDLHPGNILVQNASEFKQDSDKLVLVDVGDTVVTGVTKAECPVKLVLLDCGITATLSDQDRIKFREVFTAVVKGEGETVADLFLTKTDKVECSDPDAFRKDMAAVVTKARDSLSLSQIHVAELLSEVFNVLRVHKVKLESNFATVILAIGVLEGLGRSLDPNLDILEKAKPVLLSQTLF